MTFPVKKRHEVVQPLDKPFRYIPLTQGQTAIVDTEDFQWLKEFSWFAAYDRKSGNFYACRFPGIRMHNVIMRCTANALIDHKNHDTLDNRHENLRMASENQSAWNRRKFLRNTSGFKGVSKTAEKLRPWRARIMCGGKDVSIGKFSTAEEAGRAYAEKAKELHGEFYTTDS